MTVAELISVLLEMDWTDIVVVAQPLLLHSADREYIPVSNNVYKAIVDIDGEPYNATVIDLP